MWTGTTYALASGMILEAFSIPPSMTSSRAINDITATISDALEGNNRMTSSTMLINGIEVPGPSVDFISFPVGCESSNNLDSVPPVSQQELLKMAFTTAQGIHDAVCTYRTCIVITTSQFELTICARINFDMSYHLVLLGVIIIQSLHDRVVELYSSTVTLTYHSFL